MKGFAASTIDTATTEDNQRIETKLEPQNRAFRGKPLRTFPTSFPLKLINLLPPNRCLVRGLMSQNATGCHGICKMGLAKKTQHDRSEVSRLPRKMTTGVPKCCACHENCDSSSAKILHLPHKRLSTRYKTCRNVRNMSECHKVLPAMREEATRHVELPKCNNFGRIAVGRAILHHSAPPRRSLANSFEWLRTQKQRRASTSQPPDPQVKQEGVRSEKICKVGRSSFHEFHGCLTLAQPLTYKMRWSPPVHGGDAETCV